MVYLVLYECLVVVNIGLMYGILLMVGVLVWFVVLCVVCGEGIDVVLVVLLYICDKVVKMVVECFSEGGWV